MAGAFVSDLVDRVGTAVSGFWGRVVGRAGLKRSHSDVEDDDDDDDPAQDQRVVKKKRLTCTSDYIYKALFEDGRNSDVTLVTLGRKWRLHKVYLSQSPYFSSMFSGTWKESSEEVVHIEILDERITIEAIQVVLGSLYREHLSVDLSLVVPILAAATLFQLEGLIDHCAQIMAESVSPQTVAEYYESAVRYGTMQVKSHCYNWLLVNLLPEMPDHPDQLARISPVLMADLVEDPDLVVVQTEFSLYVLMKLWIFLRERTEKGEDEDGSHFDDSCGEGSHLDESHSDGGHLDESHGDGSHLDGRDDGGCFPSDERDGGDSGVQESRVSTISGGEEVCGSGVSNMAAPDPTNEESGPAPIPGPAPCPKPWTGTPQEALVEAHGFFATHTGRRALNSTRWERDYSPVIGRLRVDHLTSHHLDLEMVRSDGIVPKAILVGSVVARWGQMLRVNQGVEQGPKEVEPKEFERLSLRCGRLLSDGCGPGQQMWRWTGFGFGLDLVMIWDGWSLRMKRSHRSDQEGLVSHMPRRNVAYRATVFSRDPATKQERFRQSSGLKRASLSKNEEVRVLKLNAPLAGPILLSVNFMLVGKPRENSE